MPQEQDVETMSMEELAALANGEQTKEEKVVVEEPVKEEEESLEHEEETIFRREIDLGDGSGKQVFESSTMEGLIDALAQAQTHATKKIRELSREAKVEKVTTAAEKELTADEEWLLSQELLNHPAKTQKKIIEGMFGAPIEEVRESLRIAREVRAERDATSASEEFVKNTADYYACPENGKRIMAYVKTYNLTPSVENYEKAYNDLLESGLLKSKPDEKETPAAESGTAEQQERGIAKSEAKPVTTQRRVGSGLTARGRAAVSVKAAQPTEDELYDMPLEKLAQLANQAARVNSE